MMSEREILETLEQLRAQIAAMDADGASKARLQSLVQGLEQKLRAPTDKDHHLHLIEEVKEAISYFEVEHPRLTGILNDLMMALSSMGI